MREILLNGVTIQTNIDKMNSNFDELYAQPKLIVSQTETSGTDGGTISTGSFQTRTLNTVDTNTIVGATLVANQILLPVGTYLIDGSAPAGQCGPHKARLRNVSNSITSTIGTSEYSITLNVTTRSKITGILVVSGGPTTFELQHYITSNPAGTLTGGVATSTGEIERYSEITFYQLPI